MLFKNETKKSVMVRLDDKKEKTGYRWITVKPDQEIELRQDIGNNSGFTAMEVKKETKKEDNTVRETKESTEDKKDKDNKYSKTDLIDATKEDQVKILKELGLSEEDIKKLKNEEKRVKKILKLQDGKNN